jgi:hypothetical protein
MDIDKEFAAADRRIQRSIERNYLIAMAKLEGMTPEAYAAKLDQEARQKAVDAAAEASRAVGRAYGVMARSLSDAINNIAEGFREAFGR